jgi:hypothetical protein
MKNTLTKLGLTGNSGFIGNIHISAPYDSNGGVFVEAEDMGWVRVPKETAKRHKLTAIQCYVCESPAVRLDHLWPYHSEMNACACHLRWYSEWVCEAPRKIGNLCRIIDGELVVFKTIRA